LVRTSDCGSEGRRFEPGLPPQKKRHSNNHGETGLRPVSPVFQTVPVPFPGLYFVYARSDKAARAMTAT
jgi:hypothetical protein